MEWELHLVLARLFLFSPLSSLFLPSSLRNVTYAKFSFHSIVKRNIVLSEAVQAKLAMLAAPWRPI
jgi:hypothetical protein